MKLCEKCKCEHDGTFATGRFCSRKCSTSFAKSGLSEARRSEINARISEKLTKYSIEDLTKKCPCCGVTFVAKQLRNICCSRSCSAKHSYANHSTEMLDKLKAISSARMKLRHTSGDTSIGWQSRSGSSYPEMFFENLLSNNGIRYEREVKIGKWFADFVIADKFVLEIDGRQHDDRKEKDLEKDLYLNSKGFSVTRIKWKNPKTELGLSQMIQQLNACLVQWKNTSLT